VSSRVGSGRAGPGVAPTFHSHGCARARLFARSGQERPLFFCGKGPRTRPQVSPAASCVDAQCSIQAFTGGLMQQHATDSKSLLPPPPATPPPCQATRTGMFVAVGAGLGVSYTLLRHGRMLLQLFLGGNPAGETTRDCLLFCRRSRCLFLLHSSRSSS